MTRGVFLAFKVALLIVAAASVEGPVEPAGPPECDGSDATTCASAAMAVVDPPPPLPAENDRDWCNVVDFWTADVRDFYTVGDSAIKLIELSVESADSPK